MNGRQNYSAPRPLADRLPTSSYLRPLLVQGLRFGAVGGLATGVHLAIFALCIELIGLQPFWANFPAFSIALVIGFAGHFQWTFGHQNRKGTCAWPRAFARFVATALFGLLLNSLIVLGIVDMLGLQYGYAMVLMATLTPGAVFTVSKLWVFA